MVTVGTLALAALLIAPGVVAVLVGVTLGVVERKISRDKLYLTSFVSSIVIDVLFIWVIQSFWNYRVTDWTALEQVFFGVERFNIEAGVLLASISLVVGVVYGIGLTYNITQFLRDKLAVFRSHRRNPWQPWVGGLRDADQVMVELSSGHDVVGILAEYSRVDKERQIVLHSPQHLDFEDAPGREKLIITEDEIALVHVLTTRERKGFWRRAKEFFSS